jgi:hypothetical protein
VDKKGLTASYMYIAVSCSFYDIRMGTAAHAMLHFELLLQTYTGEAIAAVLDKTMKTWKIPMKRSANMVNLYLISHTVNYAFIVC